MEAPTPLHNAEPGRRSAATISVLAAQARNTRSATELTLSLARLSGTTFIGCGKF
jgi:hypothetical protein